MSVEGKGVRILGIDPGTATVGYGVVETLPSQGCSALVCVASGIIQTTNRYSPGVRLNMIRQDMLSIIEQYRPDMLALEAIFFFRNAKTLVPVAQARGVILEAAAATDLPVYEYTPMQVKLHVTGFGKADKKLVQFMVAKVLDLPEIIRPDDASDALAIAVCHTRMAPETLCEGLYKTG